MEPVPGTSDRQGKACVSKDGREDIDEVWKTMTIKEQIAQDSRIRPSRTLWKVGDATMMRRSAAMRFHADEDSLEEYILGQLDDQQSRELEIHLASCDPCARRLKESRDYVRAMRAASADVQCKD